MIKNMHDDIYNLIWDGPVEWNKRKKVLHDNHMIYAIFGTHYIYGPNSLLYIGRTARANGKRFDEHDWWVSDESDTVYLRLASIRKFNDWNDENQIFLAGKSKIIHRIEALLIYFHQPAYNSQGLKKLSKFYNIRIFNSGKFGTLLPELSYRYCWDE